MIVVFETKRSFLHSYVNPRNGAVHQESMMLPEGYTSVGNNLGIKYLAPKKTMNVFYLRSAKKRYGVVYTYDDVPETECDKIVKMGPGAEGYLAHEFQE